MTIAASSFAGEIVWLSPMDAHEDRFQSVGGNRLFVRTPDACTPSPKYRFSNDFLLLVAHRTGRHYALRERRLTLFPAPSAPESSAHARLLYYELLDGDSLVATYATGNEAIRSFFEMLVPPGARVTLRTGQEAFMEAWMEDTFNRGRVVGRFRDGRVFSCTPTQSHIDWDRTLAPT